MLLVAVVGLVLLLAGCSDDGGSTDSGERTGDLPTMPSVAPEGGAPGPVPPTGTGGATPSEAGTGAPGDRSSLAEEAEEEARQAERRVKLNAEQRRQQAWQRKRARTGSRDPVFGSDISWPQCRLGLGIPERPTQGLPMPLPTARYVIMGITNGPGFTRNPCLDDQVAWVRKRGLLAGAYAVASQPSPQQIAAHGKDGPFDGRTGRGALANTGYQQARANVVTMRRAGLDVPFMWVDVEPVPDFDWSGDLAANAAVVRGVVRGYRDAGLRIGVYSTPALWEQVVGTLRFGVPEWRAAGYSDRAEALRRCGADWSIQGGKGVLAQWVAQERDLNVTCPGTPLGPWFTRL